MLAGKRFVRPGSGNKKGKEIIRAGSGTGIVRDGYRNEMDF